MKEEIEDHSSEVSEKCNELFKTQAKLRILEEELESSKASFQSEINRLGEETRSLNKRLNSTQKQNDSILKKNCKLSDQMVELKKEISKKDALLHDNKHVLVLRDTRISELENEVSEHKVTVSNLREQVSRLLLL